MYRAPAAPHHFPLCHVPPQHPRRRFPARARPLPASPRRAAVATSRHASRRLPAAAPVWPCLLLDLEHILELLVNLLLHLHTAILPTFLLPELSTSLERHRNLGSPSTATAAASHPRSSALAAPQQPTEAHKPAQFRSPMLDRPNHSAGELELPPPLGLAVVPTIYCLLAPAKRTTSTTSSRRSCLATSPLLSCPPATGTPMPPLGAPPPVSVHRRPAASAPLFPNIGHPRDRRELLNLSPPCPSPPVSPLTGILSAPIGFPV
jgi:hypothetical protein